MTDKRNLVIKVKYPVSGKAAENLAPKMITEWNVKRILLAAGTLVLVLASLFYVFNSDTEKTDLDNAAAIDNVLENQATPRVEDKEADIKKLDITRQTVAETSSSVKPIKEPNNKTKQVAGITAKEAAKKQPAKKVIKDREYSKVNHNVSRAALTYEMNNKEPTGEIGRTIDVSKKSPVWVYYFTELKAMNGSKVYHEWVKNGVVVSRQELVISGDTWRTSSRKLLSDSEKGNWTARLVDKNGRVLNEKIFKVK